ncbi:MAG: short-chain fatty acyl-CoA regulator family protein [Pseudomonadota bacterium]
MVTPKIYAGPRLRVLRDQSQMTQKDFAARLGVSLPYFNQMENNNRPISRAVGRALRVEFGLDVAALGSQAQTSLLNKLRALLADPVLEDTAPTLAELELLAAKAPALAKAFIAMHSTYRAQADLVETLNPDRRRNDPVLSGEASHDPLADGGYIDPLDRAAEDFATAKGGFLNIRLAALAALANAQVMVRFEECVPRQAYDPGTRTLRLHLGAGAETTTFTLLTQVALGTQQDLLQTVLDRRALAAGDDEQIAQIGLARYFAVAALMPYTKFREAARTCRYDLDVLARQFGASIELVAQRLSMLRRPGAKGVPFFFMRAQGAHTRSNRHKGAPLQIAGFGLGCPVWDIHRAFEIPGHFSRQLSETPEGTRYFTVLRDVSGDRRNAASLRRAIALGCDVRHAPALIYADGFDLTQVRAFEPIPTP